MRNANKILQRFKDDTKGTMAITFALTLVPVLAVVGSSVDYARAVREKSRLQATVDIAAIAGAHLPATANQNREAQALKSFQTNAASATFANAAPTIQASNAQVTVSATHQVKTTVMSIFGIQEIAISASSSARSQIENGGVACLLALNEDTPDGLHLQGITKVSSPNCWAWINSSHATGINAVGASMGTGQGFCVKGGVLGQEHFSPVPYTGCDRLPDPFESTLRAPYVGDCTHNNASYSSGSFSIRPGVYCGGLSLKPHADVTAEPGVYIIKNGELEVQAQATLAGEGVTFYFVGDSRMEIRGGGNVSLKAPSEGDTAGFVFIQNRYANPGAEFVVQGGGRIKLEGILYAPTWRVNISGNGEMNQEARFWTMVADSFYMEGNGRLYVRSDAAAAGLPNLMPRIKNGPVLTQ